MGSTLSAVYTLSLWFIGLLPILMMTVSIGIWLQPIAEFSIETRNFAFKVRSRSYMVQIFWIFLLVLALRGELALHTLAMPEVSHEVYPTMQRVIVELVVRFVDNLSAPLTGEFWTYTLFYGLSNSVNEHMLVLQQPEPWEIPFSMLKWTAEWAVTGFAISLYLGMAEAVYRLFGLLRQLRSV